MEFVPWKTFGRIIERHKGDACVRTLGCADLFRIMAFSQLTWRESLRDIEVCLDANHAKLFHMGIAGPPTRSTLSDALNLRDWRIYHALALRLISHARTLGCCACFSSSKSSWVKSLRGPRLAASIDPSIPRRMDSNSAR